MKKLTEYTLNKWKSEDSWSKVLNFAKGFLDYLTKIRMDHRYANFKIFLEKPKAIKEKKRTTDRVIVEEDVQKVIRFFVRRWKAGEISREDALTHVVFTIFGAYTGQRPFTMGRQ